jgi:hypothetical protein
MGVSGWRHAPSALYPRGKDTRYPVGHCVGLRAGLDTEARGNFFLPPPGIESQSPGRPVCMWSDTILTELPQLLFLCN